ncbi:MULTISPECIES: ComEC family protein [unclassified Brenneria]|uniref:ComEC family protein n=1 Tax=unclassified Brenneria TaxID=2634434 RepID=UPI0015539655|nr:ComEC family protein [Brenneria sp. hezel4-2-4]MEE3649571.1 ComEC family protein [Brenneria sp. HEZEL_4_2_4]NPC99529.1 ComEC family protein [Brenneria sp. hezel4-2-4]
MSRLSVSAVAIAAILGILPLLILPKIPPTGVLWGGMALAVMMGWRHLHYALRIMAVVLFGFCWAGLTAQTLLQQIEQVTSRPVNAVVTINSMRFAELDESRVVIRLEKIDQKRIFPPLYANVTLSQNMQGWCGGQRWRIAANFRPVHSRLNQGGFDSQRWAISRRQPLSARIMSAQAIDPSCGLRQRIISHAEQRIMTLPWRSILLALTFGEMKTVSPETKLTLQRTGTLHLMAISGLHIALAALFGWGIARTMQYFLPEHTIGYRFPLFTSGLVAWGYVWLAGGNPPAIRAALALSLWILLRMKGVICSPWQVWLWCVALILVCDPLSVLSDSFWLSCLAVASLIFWFQWAPLPQRCQTGFGWFWLRWLHLQTGMTLLLMPLQLSMFHGFSLTSLPANLWAVPVVSLITTPLVLLALPMMFVTELNYWLWWLADRSLRAVFIPLTVMQTGWIDLHASLLIGSIAGWLMVVIWRFTWWRDYPASVVAVVLVLALSRIKNEEPNWRVDMLDVGHGLAVVIERNGKAILYDTGNRWDGGDMATREILPYLRWRGLVMEKIIVSHSHSDHAGGLASVTAAYPDAEIYSAFRQDGHQPCRQGVNWRWQGLRFTVLWPVSQVERAENNDSCVVRIDDGKHRVLLTGDIETETERQLVKWQRNALAADLLQIPHHGSGSSSSPPFIRAVDAQRIISSSARYNPWRLPSTKIVARYRQYGYEWLDTAMSGQLSVRFFNDSWHLLRFREQISPRWYHRWFGVKRYNE